MTGEAGSVRSRLARVRSREATAAAKRPTPARRDKPARPRGPKPLTSAASLTAERAAAGSNAPQMRRALTDRRELIATARQRAQSPLTSARMLATSSVGKLLAMALAILLACLLSGWYASSTLDHRTRILQDTITHAEPIAEASQVLYSSLSIADAAANAAFISGGLEPPPLRQRYSDAIATAGNALVIAASNSNAALTTAPDDTDTDPVQADLATLAANLPVYTGIVETARTNNRLGNPVGSAYLGEASTLMQEKILPAAQRLYERRAAAIADPQRAMTQPPWAVYVFLGLTLAGLVGATFYLARHTRRRLNIGVLIATIALVIGLTWLLVAGLMSVAATNDAKSDGATPLRQLTTARIETQKARSAQTLSLVRRDQTSLQQSYRDATNEVARILAALKKSQQQGDTSSVSPQTLQRAIDARDSWDQANSSINRMMAGGDFRGARTLTVGDAPDSAATYYATVDAALVEMITRARTVFRDNINTAQRVLGFSGNGIWTLGIIAAIAAPIGLFPRIREYM